MKKYVFMASGLLMLSYLSSIYTKKEAFHNTAEKCLADIEPLRIATYNIRRLSDEKSPQHLWDNRKPLLFDMIHAINPDIIGFQEVVKEQFDELKDEMPEYESFGKPRSTAVKGFIQKKVMQHPKAKDEHNPLFYNTERMALVNSGDFSINPRGRLMRAYLPRICTWGLFQDKETGKQLYVYNAHLDYSSHIIRRKQIDKICKHVKRHTQDKPVVFMGDLNTRLGGKNKQRILTSAGFVHAKLLAQTVLGPTETRTGWNNGELKTIDHIFIKAPRSVVPLYEVVASQPGVFPSDHRPVFTDIQLP
jgi:endonuclease/exonuclease/phosphatase family metal-dependent hydrolase